ncbi:putative uncharacterized protein [Alistipes sp. CAG:53]|nr:putative uncharacterized protein [Alistipes sp. CAG:53]
MLAEGACPVGHGFEVDRTVALVGLLVGEVLLADLRLVEFEFARFVAAGGQPLGRGFRAAQVVLVLGVERTLDRNGKALGHPVAQVLRQHEQRLRRVVEDFAVTGLRQQRIGVLALSRRRAGQVAVRIDVREGVGCGLERIAPDAVGAGGARTRFVLAFERGGQIDVELGVFVELDLDVRPEVEPTVEDRRVVPLHVVGLEQAVLVVEAARDVVFGRRAAARDVDVDALVERVVLVEPIHPVDVGVQVGVRTVAEHLDVLLRVEVVSGRRIVHLGELDGVDHVGNLGWLHHAGLELDVDLRLAYDTSAGGDQHDAVGAAYAVDGGRRGVLEDRELLDVLDVHQVEVALDAVDQHQRRLVRAEGADAADPEGRRGARFARTLYGDDARELSGQVVRNLARGHLDVVDRNGGYRADDAGLFLGAVADDDDLFEVVVRRKGDHFRNAVDRELLRLVTDVGDGHEAEVAGERIVERTVRCGARAECRILDPDRGADDRLPGRGIEHLARDVLFSRRGRGCGCGALCLRTGQDDVVLTDDVGDAGSAQGFVEQLGNRFRRFGDFYGDVVRQVALVGDPVGGLRFDLLNQPFQAGYVFNADRSLLGRRRRLHSPPHGIRSVRHAASRYQACRIRSNFCFIEVWLRLDYL